MTLLIGSGPSVLSRKRDLSGFGRIVKVNRMPTGYEEYIGSRIDWWCVATRSSASLSRNVLVSHSIRRVICAFQSRRVEDIGDVASDIADVVSLSLKRRNYIQRRYQYGKQKPSTGIWCLDYLLYVECIPHVQLLGMDNFCGSLHHYYDTMEPYFPAEYTDAERRYIDNQITKGKVSYLC